jgi:hypothetical protein
MAHCPRVQVPVYPFHYFQKITMNIHKGLPKQRLMVKASITQVPSLIQSRTHFVRLTHVFWDMKRKPALEV